MGYTARRLGKLLAERGWRVTGTSRTEKGVAALRAGGVAAIRLDRDTSLTAATLEGFDAILVSAPPDERGDPVLDAIGEALTVARRPRWIGYLSTSGVYGQAHGAWVDELTPPHPGQARSIRRLQAETRWLNLWHDHQRPVEVFRLAGIYGPGRSALDTVRAGRAHRVLKPGHVVSRTHVDDVAQVLCAALDKPAPGTIYNVADDEPAPPQDVTVEACALLGVEPPPAVRLEDAGLSPMALSFYAETRRVWAGRVKGRLGVRLRFPTYREGLRAILAEEGEPQ